MTELTATQLPNLPIWAVSEPGFHCALARVVQTPRGFDVTPTRPGLIHRPELAGLAADGLATIGDAMDRVSALLPG